MYTPGRPGFHHFMSTQEFMSRYAPTADQVNQVSAYLAGQGMNVKSVSDNRMLVHVQAPTSAIQAAFKTELHSFEDSDGTAFRGPASEPVLPADLPIRAVHGLDNMVKFKRHLQKLDGQVKGHSGTGPNGGFSPSDIRTAYKIPASANGAGESLGLIEMDGYSASNIQAYEAAFKLPQVPLNNVLVDSASGAAGGGADEVELDIELMAAVAPGAKQIVVYEGPNNDTGILDTYSRIAHDNVAREVSSSWGEPEDGASSAFLQSENTIFKQMAAQGQSIYAAAGDNGAYDDGSGLSVDDPASQPYVVGVGGTKLTTDSSGARTAESAWGNGNGPGAGGGGGVSTVWPLPAWQASLGNAQNQGSTTMRNVPDVSLNADPTTGYSIYTSGNWAVIGGTSAAAPLWAAFTALVNQARLGQGVGPVGFPNPQLYAIGKGSGYGSAFFDVLDASTNGHFPAVAGFDNATGWGSFDGAGLFSALASNPSSCS
jgi:kumamolisin